MSRKDLPRIKQIRQKVENNDYSPYPIGSEGQYIDMLSKLDLEEELKLGGNHYVTVEEFEDKTIVREKYFHKPLSEINIEEEEEEEDFLDYQILTTILNEGEFSFFVVDEENNFIQIADNNDEEIYLGSGEGNYQNESINSVIIYPSGEQGYYHQKDILIEETENEEQNSIITTIAEEVNNI